MGLRSDLEREHREIDEGIELFRSGLAAGAPVVEALTGALAELRRHIYFEEEWLFPPLQAAGLLPPLFVMRREHGEIWAAMVDLSTAGTSGADRSSLKELVHQLATRLLEHNSKEEMIVYPAADEMIAAPIREQLAAALGEVKLPSGWVCQARR